MNWKNSIITSDDLFELKDLPKSIAVYGLSILGAEIAQCFSRLGIKTYGYMDINCVGCLSDSNISNYALKTLSKEIEIIYSPPQIKLQNNKLTINQKKVEKIFVATSRKANLDNMNVEEIGIRKENMAIANFNPETMQVEDQPIFIAGDVKTERSILHEAVIEGKIAGKNAVADEIKSYPRKTRLEICYTDPIIAIAGQSFRELEDKEIIIGSGQFDNQGRAKIMGVDQGKIHIYAGKSDRKILGAEIFAPQGEHLAHLLAHLIQNNTTIEQALNLPYYHPTLEETIKSAFEDLSRKNNQIHISLLLK